MSSKFVGLFPPEDLEQIKQAIEEDCGMASLSQGQYTKKR